MTVRTQLKAGSGGDEKIAANHNEAIRVRSQLKAGGGTGDDDGRLSSNHNEAIRVRSQLKASGGIGDDGDKLASNHNEAFRREARPAISMRKQVRTAARENDRLMLLVVRTSLKAGRSRERYPQLGRHRNGV